MTDFQEELRRNLRSPETVAKEREDEEIARQYENAAFELSQIKDKLIESAKNAQYTVENGVTRVFCLYKPMLGRSYLRMEVTDNMEQLVQDRKRLAIFRDPDLVYHSWRSFEIDPRWSDEYRLFSGALKELTAKENIVVEFVVYNPRNEQVYPFPSTVDEHYSMSSCELRIKASTAVAE